MAWKKPSAKEVACGMEINMYGPSEDDRNGRDDRHPL
ncbi:pyrroloquinoline quinone precursor peptide PqqA [Falsirhodobacter sp. 1013]